MVSKKFSLIELIVVVAVLVIISSMVLPSLKQMLQYSAGVECMSNMRFLGSAHHLYVEDHGKFTVMIGPTSTSNYLTRSHRVSFDDLLGAGYDGRQLTAVEQDKNGLLGSEALGADIYACPQDEMGMREPSGSLSLTSNLERLRSQGKARTYLMNSWRSAHWIKNENKKGIVGYDNTRFEINNGSPVYRVPWSQSLEKIEAPSQMLLMTEKPGLTYLGTSMRTNVWSPLDQESFAPFEWHRARGVQVENPTMKYHNGGWNYLFVDGHVESLLPEYTIGAKGTLNQPQGYWTNSPND